MKLKNWAYDLINGDTCETTSNYLKEFLMKVHNNDLNHEFYGLEISEVIKNVEVFYGVSGEKAISLYGKDVINKILEENDIYSWEHGLLVQEVCKA